MRDTFMDSRRDPDVADAMSLFEKRIPEKVIWDAVLALAGTLDHELPEAGARLCNDLYEHYKAQGMAADMKLHAITATAVEVAILRLRAMPHGGHA